MEIKRIVINKNRGWRGLAEIQCYGEAGDLIVKNIFSFSQDMWNDMLRGRIVVPYENNFLVLEFTNTEALPRGQRSVLIKNFSAEVFRINTFERTGWNTIDTPEYSRRAIYNFVKNRNNHTQSDWNCIGIRVIPMI